MIMKNLRLPLLLAAACFCLNVSMAQNPKQKGLEAITKNAVQGQLEFLSSDWTEGRQTGAPGAYMAADYIASMFKVYGLEPGGDMEYIMPSWAERMQGKRPSQHRTYYQSFNLLEYKPGDSQEMSLVNRSQGGTRTVNFAYRTDFSVRPSDVSVEIDMPVVFAGYGLSDKKSGYDDYKDVDVKGKIVLCLSGFPGEGDTLSKGYSTFGNMGSRALRRLKSEKAAELGVAAMIEVEPGSETSASWADNLPFRYNSSNYEGDVARESYYETSMEIPGSELDREPLRISISDRVLNEIIKDSGIDLGEFKAQVKNSLKPASRVIPGKSLRIKTTVDSKMIRVRNVVGVIPGKDTSEVIVIGAHYDHLGKHDGWIWNGADDNASGTVGVMTLAKAFMAAGQQPEKTIVFAAWTGEEKGLLGSEYFASHPYNNAGLMLNLNYDMISRDNEDDTLGVKCELTYTKKYSVLQELTEKNNQEFGLGLDIKFKPSENPRGGSDHTPFAQKGIPVMYFEAGFPPEYHQPDDHINLVNWDKLTNIIRIGYLNIWDLSNTEWGPAE